MPGRLRQPAEHSVAASSAEKAYSIPGLDFHQALTWRAGKAIAVADLLERLQKLSGGLRRFEQDEVDRNNFAKIARDLANTNLLGHKDRGIRAWTMCCIVDILRLCAPEAPYTLAQLKDIFTVFIKSILPALAEPTNAYNTQHVYILGSLVEFESIVLLTDTEGMEHLIQPLFTACFDIVSDPGKTANGHGIEKTVEYSLSNLLTVIIEGVQTVPQEVTDVIISQFLRVDPRPAHTPKTKTKKTGEVQNEKQGTLLLKDYPPAYNLAKLICTSCPEKMTVHISQYFNNVLTEATSENEAKNLTNRRMSLDDSDDEAEYLADLNKAHRLIRELWRACPDVLQNVIPQIEGEFSAESVPIRLLATQTLGDIASGIGLAGPPTPIPLEPAAFPLPTISTTTPSFETTNKLLTPVSPKPFAVVHAAAYNSFLNRRNDKSVLIRAAWVTAAGRILLTVAGGIGLQEDEEKVLLSGLAQMLGDADEKVRLSAVRAVGSFGYSAVINRLAADGGLAHKDSVLTTLASRVKDRRPIVREEAMKILGRLWGVASADIEANVEQPFSSLGEAPRLILDAFYLNEPEVHTLIDTVMFEILLPLSYPPIKVQISRTESQRQRAKGKEDGSQEAEASNPDAIRARRILTFLRNLDTRAKTVFFAMQTRQIQLSKVIGVYLKACEDYNGGVVDENLEAIKTQLTKLIEVISKPMADSVKVSADLWKFAKMHDRRSYQLIRFAMAPESDYRTVTKAIKELTKRIQTGPTNAQSLLETLTPLLYRCSLLIFSRSHVPTMMDISRTDENGLAEAAHDMLREISSKYPAVLKTHVQTMCKDLESNVPTLSVAEDSSAADTLKSCALFARKYPAEVSKDRKFLSVMTSYALFSRSPRAAKHAISIVMTVADKKEMYAKDILQKAVKDCKHTSPLFLSRLAAIAQICLLAPASANAEDAAIVRIALLETLFKNRNSPKKDDDQYLWQAEADDETLAKELALKILVNRCISEDEKVDLNPFDEPTAEPVYQILMKLIEDEGELAPLSNTPLTPADQKPRLRLIASKYLLKLCSRKRSCEERVSAKMFNTIALVIQDRCPEVRAGFVSQLKKYLGQNRLNTRWYAVLFLLAFDPDQQLRFSTTAWLKSRVEHFTRQQQQAHMQGRKGHENVMEVMFTRLLSLLIHHPDYPQKGESYDADLVDFARYICFYLTAVATDDSLSLIFHVAQRVKQTRDGVSKSGEMSERLYVLSDLAQATIRNYADMMPAHQRGVHLLQTWPGKLHLPSSVFAPMPSHDAAQEVADKNYLPEEVAGSLEEFVRAFLKKRKSESAAKHSDRKRRSDAVDDEDKAAKRAKTSLPVRRASLTTKTPKTPKPKRRRSSELESRELPSRKSARMSHISTVSYEERDSDEDDADMEWAGPEASSRTMPAAKATLPRVNEDPAADVEEEAVGSDVEDEEKENAGDEQAALSKVAPTSPLRAKSKGGRKKISSPKRSVRERKAAAAAAVSTGIETRETRRRKG